MVISSGLYWGRLGSGRKLATGMNMTEMVGHGTSTLGRMIAASRIDYRRPEFD